MCTVSMSSDRSVFANFQPATFALTVNLLGSGTGTVSGGGLSCTAGTCAVAIANTTPAQTVTLTATPGASSVFAGWAGACSGMGSCTVTMSGARDVWAYFNPQ